MNWGSRRHLRGGNIFCLNQVPSCCVQTSVLSAPGGRVKVMRVHFAGAGKRSRWTAAAATAQRSQVPAQRACVQRASASPLEGAVIGQPANSPQ